MVTVSEGRIRCQGLFCRRVLHKNLINPHRTRLKIATKKMSSSEPAQKKAKLEESSSSSTSSAETYPVIDRVANGAHVRGMAAYQAM